MAFRLDGLCPLIEVFDMPTSLRFYCDLLGFRVRSSSGPLPDCGWVWMDFGTAQLMLNTMYDNKRPVVPDSNAKLHIVTSACIVVAMIWTVLTSIFALTVSPSFHPRWLLTACASCICETRMGTACAFNALQRRKNTTQQRSNTAGPRKSAKR